MTSAPLTPTLTDADLIASWSQRALAAEARAAQLEAELRMMTGRFALQKVSGGGAPPSSASSTRSRRIFDPDRRGASARKGA